MTPREAFLSLAALAALAGCRSAGEPTPPRLDAELESAPVFQPLLVVGMPDLQARAAGRPMEAIAARNAPLADVLLGFFRDSDVNLVLDPAVEARNCTFDIKQATVEEAFESLLASLDLAYQWDGSFLRIQPTVRRTLFVDLLQPNQNAMGPGGGGGGGVPQGGGANQGRDFWTELEQMMPQVLGQSGRSIVNQAASTVHVEGAPSAVARFAEIVDTTLRRRNAQVSLEARILEVRLNDQYNLGVDWSLLPGLFKSNKTGLAADGGVISQTASSGGTALNFGVLDAGDFSVFVDALQSQGQVRVLSSPRVATMNNVPATLRVVDQVPIVRRQVIDDQGVARTEYDVEFVEAGVQIAVTPMIGEDGQITVDVRPQITEQTGTIVTPDGLVEQPILSTRGVQNIVRVADGQTIVLGGLRSTRKDETLQGIPFLMDLPFLGQLFSSTVQNRDEVELMIVLVPRVLDSAWIDEEVRRGSHRLADLRRPYQWNPMRLDGFRREDWSGGLLQGQPVAAGEVGVRHPGAAPAAEAVRPAVTITRQGLADRLVHRAQQALDQGQLRQAIALLEEAIALEPRRADALVAAGVLCERLGNRQKARQWLDRALLLAPDDANALTARGALELAGGSAPAAQRWLERAHSTLRNATSANNLAAAMLLAGDHAAARTLLREVPAGERPPELFANLAAAELFGGDLEAARRNLRQALATGADPRNPRLAALQRMVGEPAPQP